MKPFKSLSEEEKNIFLFGFQEYKFLKPKGRPHAITDYFRWQGLYAYISHDLKKIETSKNIKLIKEHKDCPFCTKGFKNEVLYYYNNENKNITEYLR